MPGQLIHSNIIYFKKSKIADTAFLIGHCVSRETYMLYYTVPYEKNEAPEQDAP